MARLIGGLVLPSSNPNPPPATRQQFLWGSSAGSPAQSNFATFESQVGHIPIRRSYNTDVPTNVQSGESSWDYGQRAHVTSWHPDQGQVAAGMYDSRIRDYVQSCVDRTFILQDHEADSKVRRGNYTAASFRAAQARTAQIVASAGNPLVTMAMCLTDYWVKYDGSSPGSVSNWNNYYVDGIPTFAPDHYNAWVVGNKDNKWQTLQQLTTPAIAWAVSKGMRYAVSETGCHDDPNNPQRKPQWLQDAADWLASQTGVTVDYCTYFNSNVGDEDNGGWYINKPATYAAFSAILDQLGRGN